MLNMNKKLYTSILLVIIACIKVGFTAEIMRHSSHSTDNFNPESATFSQMKTLMTWVAKEHSQDPTFMKTLQRNVAMEVPENSYSYHLCCKPIQNNAGDTRYYGKSFPTIKHPALSFLKYVHNISATANVNVLEIAASLGLNSWKVPYAFQKPGRVYVNELSTEMLKIFEQLCEHRFVGKEALKACITPLPGSCFDILRKNPELKGRFNAIYVQNLEHFLNPQEHQLFLELIADLLAEDGRAFLVAHTFPPDQAASDNPVQILYKKNRASGILYPGFHQATLKARMLIQSHIPLPGIQVSDVIRPTDTAICGFNVISQSEPVLASTSFGLQQVGFTTQIVTTNTFTPEVYRDAIRRHRSVHVKTSLEILDSFFLDSTGNNYSSFVAAKEIIYTGVVIRKKPTVSVQTHIEK